MTPTQWVEMLQKCSNFKARFWKDPFTFIFNDNINQKKYYCYTAAIQDLISFSLNLNLIPFINQAFVFDL